jgi:hypothetical protein
MIKLGKWPMLASSALLISIALAGCASGPTSTPTAATQQRIEAAQSRADHEALAAYYDREAAAARSGTSQDGRELPKLPTRQGRRQHAGSLQCNRPQL